MNVILFGGTTEGRELAAQLAGSGVKTTVSVATDLGAEELNSIPGITVLAGRRDSNEIQKLVAHFDCCIDATHPYATEVTANIRGACLAAGVPLHRLLRPASCTEGAICVPNCAAAASYLAGQTGRILLATGAKELSAFAALEKTRLFARVLPTHDSLNACEALGLPHKNILAMQGPFTQKMNEAILEQYHIKWLVTKDGGKAGGFSEKLAAAHTAGAQMLLVGRPPECDGESCEEILRAIQEAMI